MKSGKKGGPKDRLRRRRKKKWNGEMKRRWDGRGNYSNLNVCGKNVKKENAKWEAPKELA